MLSFAAPSWQSAILAQNPRKGYQASGLARIATPVVPRLFLSDYFFAHDEKQLMKLNITHVVSVLDREPTIPDCIPEDRRMRISVADRSDVQISPYLTPAVEFITSALAESEQNNVLVHCFQGVSRSATVVCAYLVATTTMTAFESIAYVQGKRSIVCPNLGFRKQLQAWSVEHYGEEIKRGRVAKLTGGFAERFRELKAIAGGAPSTTQLKPRPPKPAPAAS